MRMVRILIIYELEIEIKTSQLDVQSTENRKLPGYIM